MRPLSPKLRIRFNLKTSRSRGGFGGGITAAALTAGASGATAALGARSTGAVRYERDSLSFQSFAAAMFGRCLQFRAINTDLQWL